MDQLSDSRQAGTEFEITPEMIEAGVDALDSTAGVISDFGVVREVYISMVRAARRLPPG